MGNNTSASGDVAIAMGLNSSASGMYSTAIGTSATASGLKSFAMGSYVTAGTAANAIVLGAGAGFGADLINNTPHPSWWGSEATAHPLRRPRQRHRTYGNVGIGTTAPAHGWMSRFLRRRMQPRRCPHTAGSGNAGTFSINNAGSVADVLHASTIGDGRAGYFQINNNLSAANALYSMTIAPAARSPDTQPETVTQLMETQPAAAERSADTPPEPDSRLLYD